VSKSDRISVSNHKRLCPILERINPASACSSYFTQQPAVVTLLSAFLPKLPAPLLEPVEHLVNSNVISGCSWLMFVSRDTLHIIGYFFRILRIISVHFAILVYIIN